MAARLGMALDVLDHVGGRRFILEVLPWLLRRRYVFYAARADELAAPFEPKLSVRIDRINESDLTPIAATRPGIYSVAQLGGRLRQGHLGLVGRLGSEIVHIRWVFRGFILLPYLGHRLALEEGEGLVDEMYTVPAWRRMGVEAAVARQMPEIVQAHHFRRLIGVIAGWNRVPQRMAQLHGYRAVGSGGYWGLPGIRRFFCDGEVRLNVNGDLTVGADRRPVTIAPAAR
jgi:hypothetical protein